MTKLGRCCIFYGMRAYLNKSVSEFLEAKPEELLMEIVNASQDSRIQDTQKRAWHQQIMILRDQLEPALKGQILFEFTIPRVGRRVDVCLVTNGPVFVMEFKINATAFASSDQLQAIDYALDLKNFHEHSHRRNLVPVLVSTAAKNQTLAPHFSEDGIAELVQTNGSNIKEIVSEYIAASNQSYPDEVCLTWHEGRYKPTPTIVEAAKALYQGHSVDEISRSEAGAENLSTTSARVQNLILDAKKNNQKIVCFITGVPGSGKTLAGLNIATNSLQVSGNRDGSVFLSGNGPLVAVLQEALARDEVQNAYEAGMAPPAKHEALRKARLFVQIIHRWRDEYLVDSTAPEGRVVVFDEAQRAWTLEQTSNFMRQKKGQHDFAMSEPEYLLSVMARHKGWCAVVCLVGSGQEINTGEAGISEWLEAIHRSDDDWTVYLPEGLSKEELGPNSARQNRSLVREKSLHLATSIRSFRSDALSDFVSALLDGDAAKAKRLSKKLKDYPIKLTRDLDDAREWLVSKARGTERYGLVASSNALRLKPEGIHIKSAIEPSKWFLNDRSDVRASYALEDAGTEFDVQGLELDWVGVCWDANFIWRSDGWFGRRFVGTKWQSINEVKQKYLKNAYRVLLTRARQGMVIYVPLGSDRDSTRSPGWYDDTFAFISSCLD